MYQPENHAEVLPCLNDHQSFISQHYMRKMTQKRIQRGQYSTAKDTHNPFFKINVIFAEK